MPEDADAIIRPEGPEDPLEKAVARAMQESDNPDRLPINPLNGVHTEPERKLDLSNLQKFALEPKLLERRRVIAGVEADQRTEVYRQLRTQVFRFLESQSGKTVAITSPQINAGKTLTAVNLAISMAHEVNQQVLLVDLDLSKPEVHETLGVEIQYGVPDVLNGTCSVEEAMFETDVRRLTVLPGRPTGRPSSELLTSPEMKTLMHACTGSSSFTSVVFDLPPILRNDDALVFTPNTDGVLLVIEDGANTSDDIARAMEALRYVDIIGTVLNKVR